MKYSCCLCLHVAIVCVHWFFPTHHSFLLVENIHILIINLAKNIPRRKNCKKFLLNFHWIILSNSIWKEFFTTYTKNWTRNFSYLILHTCISLQDPSEWQLMDVISMATRTRTGRWWCGWLSGPQPSRPTPICWTSL